MLGATSVGWGRGYSRFHWSTTASPSGATLASPSALAGEEAQLSEQIQLVSNGRDVVLVEFAAVSERAWSVGELPAICRTFLGWARLGSNQPPLAVKR